MASTLGFQEWISPESVAFARYFYGSNLFKFSTDKIELYFAENSI
jgi:hypothetical protein